MLAVLDAQDAHGTTALMAAAYYGHTSIVKALLDSKASVDFVDVYGWIPLMRAAAYGYPEIVQILVTHGANVNAVNSRGRTALMFAYEHGYHDVWRILFDNGANENGVDSFKAGELKRFHCILPRSGNPLEEDSSTAGICPRIWWSPTKCVHLVDDPLQNYVE